MDFVWVAAFSTGAVKSTLLPVGMTPTEIKVTARQKQLSNKETQYDQTFWTETILLLSLYKRNSRQDSRHWSTSKQHQEPLHHTDTSQSSSLQNTKHWYPPQTIALARHLCHLPQGTPLSASTLHQPISHASGMRQLTGWHPDTVLCRAHMRSVPVGPTFQCHSDVSNQSYSFCQGESEFTHLPKQQSANKAAFRARSVQIIGFFFS